MIQKYDIIKMAKHVFRRSRGIPDRELMHPRRDWLVGLAVFILLMLGGGGASALSYVYYDSIAVATDPSAVVVPRYQAALIEATLERYNERVARYQALRAERPTPPVTAATSSDEDASETPEDSEGIVPDAPSIVPPTATADTPPVAGVDVRPEPPTAPASEAPSVTPPPAPPTTPTPTPVPESTDDQLIIPDTEAAGVESASILAE